jgi:hypothetical protein
MFFCSLFQQLQNWVPWYDGPEEAHTQLVASQPDHSHREALARPQPHGHTLVKLDACGAAKGETMLRVVRDEDAPLPAANF